MLWTALGSNSHKAFYTVNHLPIGPIHIPEFLDPARQPISTHLLYKKNLQAWSILGPP